MCTFFNKIEEAVLVEFVSTLEHNVNEEICSKPMNNNDEHESNGNLQYNFTHHDEETNVSKTESPCQIKKT